MAPSRKQKFMAALTLAGMTLNEWSWEHQVTPSYVYRVLTGERDGSAKLNDAIDRFMLRHLAA